MLLLGLILTVGFIVLYGLGAYYSFRDPTLPGPGRRQGADFSVDPAVIRQTAAFQMLVFGMFVSSFLGAMVICFSAAGMVTGDAENGTLQTILTRPVSRAQVILGRFLGYTTVYLAYLGLLVGSLILLTRVFAGYSPQAPWSSLALLATQGLILLALVTLISVLLPPVATGIAGFMLFGFAFIGGVVEQIGVFLQNSTARGLGRAVSFLVPTDAFFRMALEGLSPKVRDVLTTLQQMGPLSGAEVSAFKVVYGAAFATLALCAALLLFGRKDV
jgi:ABC-type transport system involved in multi-copper enzyme maturation permease subunit